MERISIDFNESVTSSSPSSEIQSEFGFTFFNCDGIPYLFVPCASGE